MQSQLIAIKMINRKESNGNKLLILLTIKVGENNSTNKYERLKEKHW